MLHTILSELAMQTHKFAKDMGKFTDLRIAPIIGGDPLDPQFEMLANRPDIIVATPGRLMHLLQEVSTFNLKTVQYLVFDEADRLFEMGFAEQLNEIVKTCPPTRQTLLFSATMPKMLVQFTRAGLKDPQLIRLDTDTKLSEELRLAFFTVRSIEKVSALLYLVRRIIPSDQQTIIFTATKHHSEFIHHLLDRIGVCSTLVYGTMDQESRSTNLKLFRNGFVKYLVVTDLAARGIDVPLLNNVINYHFPPTPKLFVHRCGRAARQGRIGYAFSLIDPEELAYAMDVHLFIDRPMINPRVLSASEIQAGAGVAADAALEAGGGREAAAYDLSSMHPSMVQTGLFPQDALDQETEYVRSALAADSSLATDFRISENAMKQYRRTRTEASKLAVKRARAMVKADTLVHIHPLIHGADPVSCSSEVQEKINFVKHLQTFRPHQTVFETGIGFGTGSQAVKGVGKKGSKEAHGVEVMKALRHELKPGLVRARVARVPIFTEADLGDLGETKEGDDSDSDADDTSVDMDEADDDLGLGEDEFDCSDDMDVDVEERDRGQSAEYTSTMSVKPNPTSSKSEGASEGGKVRMSKAERKKVKRGEPSTATAAPAAKKSDVQYQDDKYYMAYGTENEAANYSESSMQPMAALRGSEQSNASMIESAMLDISPEDAMELNKKRRIMRWDAKKRKFVTQSLEEMAQSGKGSKRIRTESGVTLGRTSKQPAGEMYEKWKKKSRREIEIAGTSEVVDFTSTQPRPNFKHNSKVPSELKSVQEIKSNRKKKQSQTLKNMSKDKRKSVLGNDAKRKALKSGNIQIGTKAGQRKVKVVMRG
jgi:ATP-dependent RNA helicase DDX54/DBP10